MAKEYADFDKLTDNIKSPVAQILSVRREALVKNLVATRNMDEATRLQGAIDELDTIITGLTKAPKL